MRIYTSEPAISRWFKNISIMPSGCWEVTSHAKMNGYPTIYEKSVNHSRVAHRISYEYFHGEIGDSCVLHRCDNRLCSNPDHLFLGTRTENMADKVAKGRQLQGESVPVSKLSELQVREILKIEKGSMTQKAIAEKYGVHPRTIGLIQSRKNWKHIS
jgi:hypothetical protein